MFNQRPLVSSGCPQLSEMMGYEQVDASRYRIEYDNPEPSWQLDSSSTPVAWRCIAILRHGHDFRPECHAQSECISPSVVRASFFRVLSACARPLYADSQVLHAQAPDCTRSNFVTSVSMLVAHESEEGIWYFSARTVQCEQVFDLKKIRKNPRSVGMCQLSAPMWDNGFSPSFSIMTCVQASRR